LIMKAAEPVGSRSIRWVVYNIPAESTGLLGGTPGTEEVGGGARQGLNDFDKIGYSGPCPYRGTTQHYIFNLYALDTKLTPHPRLNGRSIEQAIKGHILGQAEIKGSYSRQRVAGR
jgi:Raf kinase inhibitor-like YbhB/YbcL family protein